MLIKDYISKVTSAHINSPRYIEWLSVLVKLACDLGDVIETIPSEFSVRQAVGVQLDIIGDMFGVSRNLPYTASSGALSDTDFRDYILAKILKSRWDGQLGSLASLWQTIFPTIRLTIEDNLDMTLQITCIGDISPALEEMIQGGYIIPIPMGVYATYTVIGFKIPKHTVYTDTGLYAQGQMGITNQEP